MSTYLPMPTTRAPDHAAGVDVLALEAALHDRVDGEVRFDPGTRAAYATDASNFRQVPIGVVVPRSVRAAAAAVAVCREHGAPVLSRGGGTSLAGQCCNVAVVLDFSKYCHRLISVDPDAAKCVVEPGIVLDELNARLAVHGLRYGSEPATHYNCTLGGMIGNNSCGATAQRTGKVVDKSPDWRCCSTKAPDSGADPPPTTSTRKPRPARTGRLRSTGNCEPCGTPTSGRPAPGTRRFPAGCRVTTWTPCCRSRVSMWRRRWSAASPPWSPSCTRS